MEHYIVRIGKVTGDERAAIAELTPDERRAALLDAARAKAIRQMELNARIRERLERYERRDESDPR